MEIGETSDVSQIDSLNSVIEAASSDSLKLRTYENIILQLAETDSFSAEYFIKEGSQLADQLGETETKLWFAYYRSWIFVDKGHYDKAEEILENLANTSLKLGYPYVASSALNELGKTYLIQHDYNNARTFLNKSERIFETLENKGLVLAPYKNISTLYSLLKNHKKSIIYLEKSMENNIEFGDSLGLASDHISMGHKYSFQGNVHEGIKYFQKAYDYYYKKGDKINSARTQFNLGGEIW